MIEFDGLCFAPIGMAIILQLMYYMIYIQCAPKYMDRIIKTISKNYINWFIMATKWKEISWICLLAIEFLRSSEFDNLIPAVNCNVKGSLNILSKNIFCRILNFWNTILNWHFVTIITKFVIAILICKLFKSTVILNSPFLALCHHSLTLADRISELVNAISSAM